MIMFAENEFVGKKRNVRLRLKCDGTRGETRFRLSDETDESI